MTWNFTYIDFCLKKLLLYFRKFTYLVIKNVLIFKALCREINDCCIR